MFENGQRVQDAFCGFIGGFFTYIDFVLQTNKFKKCSNVAMSQGSILETINISSAVNHMIVNFTVL